MASPYVSGKPKTVVKQLTTANSNRDGSTGTVVDLVSGTAAGVIITSVRIKSRDAVSDGMIRFYVYDGTNARLYDEVPVTATSPTATTKTFEYAWMPPTPITIDGTSARFRGSTEVGEIFDLIITYGDMT